MLRKFYIFVLSVTIVSCDVAKEDAFSPNMSDDNPGNSFYALPGGNTTIDPSAFTRLREATSISISRQPQYGEARFIENGFVFYRPENALVLSDSFVIEGKTLSGASMAEEIKIIFVNKQTDLPCFAGALSDSVQTEPGKAVEIDVLQNDKACGSIISGSLSIIIAPRHGNAEVVNQKIVYTPDKDYHGDDLLFYRVVGNTRKNPAASVDVKIK